MKKKMFSGDITAVAILSGAGTAAGCNADYEKEP
jgi:hypothetical protein